MGAGGNGSLDDLFHQALGIPLQYSVNGNHINISIPSVGASYAATVSGNQITGTFSQNGGNFPLVIIKQ